MTAVTLGIIVLGAIGSVVGYALQAAHLHRGRWAHR